jgi:hypothetical protein
MRLETGDELHGLPAREKVQQDNSSYIAADKAAEPTTQLFNANSEQSLNLSVHCQNQGTRGGVVVEALRYKPEGRGLNSRWCHCNFSLT